MMKIYIYFYCVMQTFGTTVWDHGRLCDVKGYYWKDYTGDIPEDAFPGGIDINQKSIYIGQVCDYYLMIPARIYSNGDPRAYYEREGDLLNTTDNVKILCTHYPEQFKWIPTTSDEIQSLAKKSPLLNGGVGSVYDVYIGRVRTKEELTVSKVTTGDDYNRHCWGMHVEGGCLHTFKTFEVLAFYGKRQKR